MVFLYFFSRFFCLPLMGTRSLLALHHPLIWWENVDVQPSLHNIPKIHFAIQTVLAFTTAGTQRHSLSIGTLFVDPHQGCGCAVESKMYAWSSWWAHARCLNKWWGGHQFASHAPHMANQLTFYRNVVPTETLCQCARTHAPHDK